ncbi:MAG: hypothetical protein AABY32_02665 [Nanoarchaeota archaeon]
MAKNKNKVDLENLMEVLRAGKIEIERKFGNHIRTVVDIMTFCYDKEYLNFTGQGIKLRTAQEVALKLFYFGSPGNEDIDLTEEEEKWLREQSDYVDDKFIGHEYMVEKLVRLRQLRRAGNIKHTDMFQELVLVFGRRAGKTFLCSVIAAYETYKLLAAPNGCPQKMYGLPETAEIFIVNCARSKEQATILFNEIASRVRSGPYFKGRINKDSSVNEIRMFTENDKKINKEYGDIPVKGTVILRCGHSSSESLRGTAAILVIFDELAHMLDTQGGSSGAEIYRALVPTTKTFQLGGDPTKPEGRVVSISSPGPKSGKFWDLFRQSLDPKMGRKMLMSQLPTWAVNPTITREALEEEFLRDPEGAEMEFAARFAGTAYSTFLNPDLVDACMSQSIKTMSHQGEPGKAYFMHIDPALNNNIYALAIGYCEEYVNAMNERRRRVYITHTHRFVPESGRDVQMEDVEKEIIRLCLNYKIISITFDVWNSAQTIQNLRKKLAIPIKSTTFSNMYKQQIYGSLKELVVRGDLEFFPDKHIAGELKGLRVKYLSHGFKIRPDFKSDVPTDDLADCIAAICFLSTEKVIHRKLPKPTVAFGGGNIKNHMAQLHSKYDRQFSI